MKKIFLILLLPVFVSSCHFSNKYQNRESDRQDAEEITSKLFKNLKNLEFDKSNELFSQRFFNVTSKSELKNIFQSTQNKMGTLKTKELIEWNSMVSEGAIETGIYNLIYKIEFEKDNAIVTISLEKSKEGDIQIIGYNINSKAFLN